MNPDLNTILSYGLGITICLCLLSAKAGHILGKAGQPISLVNNTGPERPQVIVNVPADYKPLEPLMVDGKPALVGPRALLFISAYDRAVAAISGNGTYSLSTADETCAYETAKQAVRTVYGETFDA